MGSQERLRLYIRKYLFENGLKQYKLAEKSGYSARQFSQMMTGHRKIGLEDLEKICVALGISLTDFFTEKEVAYQ